MLALQLILIFVSIPDKRVERISLQDKRPSTTQLDNSSKHITRTSKHLIPCPFLRKKGHCLKGSRCDFSHEFDSRQSSQLRQQHSLPYNFLPPVMQYQFQHPFFNFLNYPYIQPPMDIPIRPLKF